MVAMQAWIGRLPSMLELALVVLAAWMVSGWLLPSDATNAPLSSPLQGGQKSESVNIDSLIAVPLFGDAKSAAKPKANKAAPVVQSRLNIKLLGTSVAGERSAAIITVGPGKEQQVFVIGQTIQPGVVLQTVEVDAIVVDHGGKLERIELEEEGALSSAAGNGSASGNRAQMFRSTSMTGAKPVSRAMLNREMGDFSKLLSQARVVPHFENGRANGFLIQSIVPGSLYQKIGLQNGDIIRKVNGNMINGPQQAMAMMQELQSATSVSVEINRAGNVQVLNYNIQ